MKIRYKLIIDLIIFLVIWPVMEYNFTGNMLHEILGLVLIGGFILHVIINRKYYLAMTRRLFKGGSVNTRQSISYVVNLLLFCTVVVMAISSVMISRDVFSFIDVGGFALWRFLHILCAVSIVVCVFIHVGLHIPMFISILKNGSQPGALKRIKQVSCGILALIFAFVMVRAGYKGVAAMSPLTGMQQPETVTESYVSNGETIKKEDTYIRETYIEDTQDSQEDATPTLDDYLKNMFCNGCGRHCSLLSPQCGKGRRQASQATAEYNSIYAQ